MKIDFYSHDSMYDQPKTDTVTVTAHTPASVNDASHAGVIHSSIINTGRITLNPHRMYDSHKNIKTKATPSAGETWYYKVPGASALSTGYVKEVTAHTVLFSDSRWSDGIRYVTDELEFIEKL